MSLKAYHKKRDFRSTPEPKGSEKKRSEGGDLAFVVQKHDASRLHYDLRLELDGTLKSWAVPKGPSLDPSDKRLAVHVEDHPIEYGDFEGTIPSGYGAGTVMLWDRGTWQPHDADPARALKKGKLSFDLDGEHLRGGWTLTRMRGKAGSSDKENWLLIKHDDEHARTGSMNGKADRSVKSGRTMQQIADDKPGAIPNPAGIEGARKTGFPRRPKPQLCTPSEKAPTRGDWIYEIKYDGYRLLSTKNATKIGLLTRNEKDWATRFPPIVREIESLPVESCVIDGEACILEDSGHSSFQKLQQSIKSGSFERLVYYAFDLLYLDGYSLLGVHMMERKRLLSQLLGDRDDGVVRESDYLTGSAEEVHEEACRLGLEGLIAKKADSLYTPKRTRDWLKIKCEKRQEFVIIGYTPPSGSRKHLGSLLLATHKDDRLIYAGKVGTGFSGDELRRLKKKLDARERKSCPAEVCPEADEAKGATWTKPELVAEIRFTEWTEGGRLRHPAYLGLREDKDQEDVHLESEKPEVAHEDGGPSTGEARDRKRKNSMQTSDDSTVLGVRISSPDRVLFPNAGVTKLELAKYYADVADRILPHLVNRPLSTVRCPRGSTKACFYQKHLGDTFSDPVKAMRVKEKEGEADCISIDSAEGLVTLAQFGVIELHAWGAFPNDPESPERLVWDLDPGPGVEWDDIVRGAREVRGLLDELGMASYLLATGGKGLHVIVPLEAGADWDASKSFAKQIAQAMAQESPKRYIAVSTKSKRRNKIFVDYLRNGRGATAIAPYSVRAREGAPIATPIRWDELGRLKSANHYTLSNIRRRLSALSSDPWEGYEASRSRLPE